MPSTSPAQITIEEDAASFVLTNEADDRMIDRLVAAGCTNLYQALKYLRNDLAKNPAAPARLTSQMDALIASIETHLDGEVFTASLHDFTGVGDDANSPVGINADGTFIRNAFSVYDYDGHTGYTRYTIDGTGTAIGDELYTYSNSSGYDIYMGSNEFNLGGGITKTINYKAFAVAWSKEAPTTFILSNEEGGLIDGLIASGYGNSSLYGALAALSDSSGGVITDAFMETLANCPAGSEIFTAKLRDYAGIGNAVGINTDGTLKILDIKGRDYYGKTGYATYPEQLGGVGRELFTYATSSEYYIDAGDKPGGGQYIAFSIGWSGSPTLSISPSALNMAAAGGTASFDVASGISWTVSSDQSWLAVNPAAGTGNGSVAVTAETNTYLAVRTATVTVSGTGVTAQTITITQSCATTVCTYVLSSSEAAFTDSSATGSVTVTPSDSACAWTAASNASWIDVTAGSAGTGTGTVSYSIAVNNMLAARTGTLAIAGQTFTITQSGKSACTYALSPTAYAFSSAGAAGSVAVTPSSTTCTWTAIINNSWITVTAGSSGTGAGSVSYSIAANTAQDSRTGTLTIAGQTFTVIQEGTAPSMDTVQKAYIGYYQRPADPAGQIWWAGYLATHGGSLAAIIEAFANSDESRALYGEIDSSNIASVIDAIYQALFNRQADAAGRDWYVAEFNKGAFTAATIMLNVLYGAQNDDLVTLNNKLVTANRFTMTIDPELDSSNFRATYAGDADAVAARYFLSLVTSATSSVPAQSEMTEYIKSYIADPGDAILTP